MAPPKEKKQKLSTSETISPSLSKMKKKKNKRKKRVSKSLITSSPSHSEKDLVTLSPPPISKVNGEKAMKKQNDVAMFLTEKVISAVAKNSNFVFSPASINAALTMVAASSKEEKLTSSILSFLRSYSMDELKAVFSEIATMVLADGSASGGPKISNVNGVWMEQSLGVDPSSKDLFENFFKATCALVDFRFKAEEVREEVNAWASSHTNGLIKVILPPGSVTSDTDSIFGNALYFKGTWEQKFTKSLTRHFDFHLLNDKSVSVPFMTNHKKQYVEQYSDFKVLKLPFRQSGDTNRQYSMYFYLPDAKDGLNSLVKRVASSSSTLGFLDSHTPIKQVEVGVFRIPKFKIDFGFEAKKAFNGLNLDLLSLNHKALVEIDEDGAEAAAVTVIRRYGGRGFRCGKRIDFVADHPFLFMIREDKTGTVLFVGQIFDPSKSASP
ncbi:probable non-inhibitory serpin-Z5 [Brassica rapa]|uniref:Serpin domain-containing protein n=1 Tax=Brassica campestris TaxID=3711 RepID=M4EK36_BRACM|nr:probable non-inhibitory serpin-Z5 [Brassica rapa]